MTEVITFQDASGLRVWCGRGVRSGKNRFLGGWVEVSELAATGFGRERTDEEVLEEGRRADEPDGGEGRPIADVSRFEASGPDSCSHTFAAVKSDSNGKPDVAPNHISSPILNARHFLSLTLPLCLPDLILVKEAHPFHLLCHCVNPLIFLSSRYYWMSPSHTAIPRPSRH